MKIYIYITNINKFVKWRMFSTLIKSENQFTMSITILDHKFL